MFCDVYFCTDSGDWRQLYCLAYVLEVSTFQNMIFIISVSMPAENGQMDVWQVKDRVPSKELRDRLGTHTRTHTQLFYGSGFCLGQPGWAGTRRNIHPLTLIVVINHPYLLPPSTAIHGILPVQKWYCHFCRRNNRLCMWSEFLQQPTT